MRINSTRIVFGQYGLRPNGMSPAPVLPMSPDESAKLQAKAQAAFDFLQELGYPVGRLGLPDGKGPFLLVSFRDREKDKRVFFLSLLELNRLRNQLIPMIGNDFPDLEQAEQRDAFTKLQTRQPEAVSNIFQAIQALAPGKQKLEKLDESQRKTLVFNFLAFAPEFFRFDLRNKRLQEYGGPFVLLDHEFKLNGIDLAFFDLGRQERMFPPPPPKAAKEPTDGGKINEFA